MKRVAGHPTRIGVALMLVAMLAAGTLLSGCDTNPEDTLHVSEGEPMQLEDLLYNVQISRFLNARDPEDSAYLARQPPLRPNQLYLGVFMQIQNTGDVSQTLPTDFRVVDTQGREFKPLPSKSIFALDLGGKLAAKSDAPGPETAAANGPIEGSMVLFRIDDAATEDRPLELQIPSAKGGIGFVTLDI